MVEVTLGESLGEEVGRPVAEEWTPRVVPELRDTLPAPPPGVEATPEWIGGAAYKLGYRQGFEVGMAQARGVIEAPERTC